MTSHDDRLDLWRAKLTAAIASSELVLLMGEYCESWLLSDISRLPKGCPKCSASSAEEIGKLAVDYKIAELSLNGDDGAAPLVRELAQVFGHASERLGMVQRYGKAGTSE